MPSSSRAASSATAASPPSPTSPPPDLPFGTFDAQLEETQCAEAHGLAAACIQEDAFLDSTREESFEKHEAAAQEQAAQEAYVAAVVKTQAMARGKRDRQRVQGVKGLKMKSATSPCAQEEEAAVLKIQAIARGKRDRQRVRDLKSKSSGKMTAKTCVASPSRHHLGARSSDEEEEGMEEEVKAERYPPQEEEDAVLKIQAMARGKRDRRRAMGLMQEKGKEAEQLRRPGELSHETRTLATARGCGGAPGDERVRRSVEQVLLAARGAVSNAARLILLHSDSRVDCGAARGDTGDADDGVVTIEAEQVAAAVAQAMACLGQFSLEDRESWAHQVLTSHCYYSSSTTLLATTHYCPSTSPPAPLTPVEEEGFLSGAEQWSLLYTWYAQAEHMSEVRTFVHSLAPPLIFTWSFSALSLTPPYI